MKCPKETPWGPHDSCEQIAEGLFHVTTPSHGGVYLHPILQIQMPSFLRETNFSRGGWFEEDCDWCIPYIVFEQEILKYGDDRSCEIIANGHHLKTFKGWHKELFEQWEKEHAKSA